MSDAPVIRTAILPEFDEVLTARKEKESLAAERFVSPVATARPLTRRTNWTVATSNDQYEELDQTIEETVGLILGGEDGRVGTMQELQAVAIQGDFVSSIRRAEGLRRSKFNRRLAHSIARRRAHAVSGGYYDRRVTGLLVRTLQG